jgi:putative transposase
VLNPSTGETRVEDITNLPAQCRQSIIDRMWGNIKSLASRKRNAAAAGKKAKIGRIRHTGRVKSIPFKQHGVSHKYDFEKHTVKLAGMKTPLHVHGMEQLEGATEYGACTLVRKASGLYIMATCYVATEDEERFVGSARYARKTQEKEYESVGIDMGIATDLTLVTKNKQTNERRAMKVTFSVGEHEQNKLKRLGREQSRRKLGSRNREKTNRKLRRQHEHMTHIKDDAANKLHAAITDTCEVVAMQDELLRQWKTRFGRKVQLSILGRFKAKVKALPPERRHIIPSSTPTTKGCFVCGLINDLELSDRTFTCEGCGYSEDRDVKSALFMLADYELTAQAANMVPMDYREPALSLEQNDHGDVSSLSPVPLLCTTISACRTFVVEVVTSSFGSPSF